MFYFIIYNIILLILELKYSLYNFNMPQLDILILFRTGIENTIFYWLLYIFLTRFILSKINILFNLRKELINNYFYKDILLLANLYIININYILKIISKYINKNNININYIFILKSKIILNIQSIFSLNNLILNIKLYNLNKNLYSYLFYAKI